MTVHIFIPKRLPGLNEYVEECRKSKYDGNDMKQGAQKVCEIYMIQQVRGRRFERPVWVEYTWREPNRKRDKDNISAFGRKVIQDALVKRGVIENDGWANVLGFTDRFVVDKHNPGVEILITDEVDDGV